MKGKTKKQGVAWGWLVFCFVLVYFVAFLGSIFTSSATGSEWYKEIRPAITPPNYVFPIVWNILFFMIALSLYFVIVSKKNLKKKYFYWFFAINLFLNVLWSFLYFGIRNPALALAEIVFLEISIGGMIYFGYFIDKKSGYLLVPYFIWVGFATILNYLSF